MQDNVFHKIFKKIQVPITGFLNIENSVMGTVLLKLKLYQLMTNANTHFNWLFFKYFFNTGNHLVF